MNKTASAVLIAGGLMMSVMTSSCQTMPPVMTYADFQDLEQPASPRALAYGDDPLQHVDLWSPRGAGPHPVVFMVHGGCWQTNIATAEIMNRMAQAFVDKGVAVWNVEYRGVDVDGGGYPGTFADIAAVSDLLRDKGADYGLDTSRTVALGHSAGGHLAIWMAGRGRIGTDSPLHASDAQKLRAVISIGGLPDLEQARVEAAGACGSDTVDRLVGQGRSNPFADTSPVELLPIGIPQVLVSGEADVIAPPRFAHDYAAKVRKNGEDIRVIDVPDQGHFELITPGTRAGDTVVDIALEYLEAGR